jgi:hypothetical protein
VQFGLKDIAELPSLKEFQELARFDTEQDEPVPYDQANGEPAPVAAEAVAPEAEPTPTPELE